MRFYLNDMINLRHLTQFALYRDIPTKWRLYRDHRLCDVTPPYIHRVKTRLVGAGNDGSKVGAPECLVASSLYSLARLCGNCDIAA